MPDSRSRTTNGLPSTPYALLAGLTLGWGLNWPVMKFALAEYSVWSFRAICVLTGAVGLFLIARFTGQRTRPARQEWRPLVVTALLNVTLWNVLIAFGLKLLPAGRSAILAYTMPLWTVLLSYFFLGEAMDRRRILALCLGGSGLMLLMGDEMLAIKSAPLGALLVIGGALSWSFGTICMKRWPVHMPTTSFTAWQFLFGGGPLLLGVFVFDAGLPDNPSTTAMLAVIYNIFVSFIFCHWAWFRIVQRAPAGMAALSTMMIPVIGVVSSMLVLKETPRLQEVIALALVLTSLAAIFWRAPPRQAGASD